MIKNVKSVLIGIVIGGVLASGVSSASSYLTKIEVNLEPVKFSYNQKEITPNEQNGKIYNGKEYIPASLIYKGTTYVPIRFVGEVVDKNVNWNQETRTIELSDKVAKENTNMQSYEILINNTTGMPAYDEQTKPIPKKVKEWMAKHYKNYYQGYMTVDGATYILIARGESPSSGYGISLEDVTVESGKAIVKGTFTEPQDGQMYLTVITHPTILIKVNQEVTDVDFQMKKQK